MSTNLALVLILVLAQADDGRFDVDSFVSRHPLVDGAVNVHSPHSDVGQPDFTRDEKGKSVHARTGIRVGSMTCGKFGSLKQQAKLATTTWKGIQLIRTEADLDRCLENKLYGLLLYCQAHYGLRGGIRPLKQWHREGLRILNLQYGSGDAAQSKDDRLGGGTDQKGGLTPLGRKVVVEMMRIGIMVDLSHCNEQTVLDTAVIAEAKKFPLLANHTCAREVKDAAGKRFADYERNMTDRAMRAIARTGGVIGIMVYRPYLRRRAHATVDD
ncbi:MAG: membrane dipeptidase [Planctomycetota bacterium]|jgi:membrane dipeptidase